MLVPLVADALRSASRDAWPPEEELPDEHAPPGAAGVKGRRIGAVAAVGG